jgi:hypothetical protein
MKAVFIEKPAFKKRKSTTIRNRAAAPPDLKGGKPAETGRFSRGFYPPGITSFPDKTRLC